MSSDLGLGRFECIGRIKLCILEGACAGDGGENSRVSGDSIKLVVWFKAFSVDKDLRFRVNKGLGLRVKQGSGFRVNKV